MRSPFRRLSVLAAFALAVVSPGVAADVSFIAALSDFRYGANVRLEHAATQFVTTHAGDPAALREFAAAVRVAGAKAVAADGRRLAAQLLGLVGDAADVPFLAGLLASPEDFPAGVSALGQMGNEPAIKALASAYPKANDDAARLALIKALGWSHSPAAAAPLAGIAEQAAAPLAAAAFEALSLSATEASDRALASSVRPEAAPFQLAAARSLARRGSGREAAIVAERLLASPATTAGQRVSAARILIDFELTGWERALATLSQGADASSQGLVLDYFAKLPAARQQAIVGELQAAPDAPETAVRLARLQGSLPPSALIPFLASADKNIRLLAQIQIARRPDRASYDRAIGDYLAPANDEAGKTWLNILVAMPRPVDAWLAESIVGATTPSDRVKLCQLVKRRTAVGAASAVLPLVRDQDPKVRLAALEALGAVGLSEPDAALDLVASARLPAERREAANALRATYRRAADRAAFVAATLARLSSATEVPVREALLAFLGESGAPSALQALWAIYDGGDATIRATILRALGKWPDVTPLDRLAQAAKSETAPNLRILALRDYLDLLDRASGMPVEEKLGLIERGLPLAERDEERLAALSVAGAIRDARATRIFDALAAQASIATEVAAARKAHAELLAPPVPAAKAAAKAAAVEPDDET